MEEPRTLAKSGFAPKAGAFLPHMEDGYDTRFGEDNYVNIGDLVYFFSDESNAYCYGDGYTHTPYVCINLFQR